MGTWDETRQQIAEALGTTPEKLPRHDTHEWYSLLSDLQSSHPELVQRAREVLVEHVAPEPLPTHAEIASERRRASVLARLSNWAQRRDPTQPHRTRTNRMAVLLAIGLVMVVVMLVFRAHQPAPQQPTAHKPPQQAAPTSQQPTPTTTPTPSQTAPGQSSQSTPQTPLIPVVPPPPLPPGFPQPSPQARGGASGAQGAQGGTTVVGTQQSSGGVQVVAPKAQTGGLVVVPGTAAAAGAGGAPGGASTGGGLQIVTAQAQGTGQPGGAPTAAGGAPTEQSKAPSFQVGDQFTVKMLTPLAVSPAWQAIPAVAQGVDGPLSGWRVLGSASLGQDGSIQISWTQALSLDGKTTVALHGIAYDPKEGKPGIPHAHTQVMAPQAAKTVLSGTLGAVSQYVQDQIQAQQVQVIGSFASFSSQVPPFWQIAAQQLATGFQPAPVQTGGIILVSRVPAGTPVVVFITAPSP